MKSSVRIALSVACLGLSRLSVPLPAAADVFGNGSAGARSVAVSGVLTDTNLQYTSFTVEPGVTLSVPSGVVIRCTGPFVNHGSIRVQYGARGAVRSGMPTAIDLSDAPAHPGASHGSAGSGEIGSVGRGGSGGLGLSSFEARMTLAPGTNAGGGGGAGMNTAGRGGGALTVLAQTAIVNNGSIVAGGENAGPGGGGGAGGIIILASSGSVTNDGALYARGGRGGTSDEDEGIGGGGGGGIVHRLAPTIDGAGSISVSRGTGGTAGTSGAVTAAIRAGGGGGGACGGRGGSGGSVDAAGDPSPAGFASSGWSLTTLADPASLF